MANRLFVVILILTVISGSAAALAEEAKVTDEMVIAHVAMTVAAMEKDVKEVFAKIDAGQPPYVGESNPDFYAFVYDLNVTLVSHPNPKIRGKNLKGLPDAAGKDFRDEIIKGAKTKGKGWVTYEYKKPDGGDTLFKKKTYYQLVKGSDGKEYVVCCGEYQGEV